MNRVARTAKILVTALVLVLIMTGCMRSEFFIELKEDGTGTLSSVFAMTEESYNLFLENGTDPFEGYTTDKKVIDGVTYVYYTEDSGKLSFKEIEEKLLEFEPDANSADPIPLFKEVSIEKKSSLFQDKYIFKMVTNKDAVTDTEGMSASDIMTVFVSVKMPGEVKSHKAEDGVVNITINEYSEEKTYEIVSIAGSSLLKLILILLIVFVIIIAMVVVIIVVVSRKKNKGSDTQVTQEEQTEITVDIEQ